MTEALDAYGTLLKRGDGGGTEVFTTIAELTSISGPSLTAEAYEATRHDGPHWDEYVVGLLRGGEISLELNFVPTNATQSYAAGMLSDMVARTLRNYELVFPDSGSTTWGFAAFITAFNVEAPVDNKLSGSATLRISGAPTLA